MMLMVVTLAAHLVVLEELLDGQVFCDCIAMKLSFECYDYPHLTCRKQILPPLNYPLCHKCEFRAPQNEMFEVNETAIFSVLLLYWMFLKIEILCFC